MPQLAVVRVYTDGGARGNPGPAAIGVVICDIEDRVLERLGEYIGETTNNQAEYHALIKGLQLAANHTHEDVDCVTDSELIVRQMTGKYRTRDSEMRKLCEQVKQRERSFKTVKYLHLPRLAGHLAEADRLVNSALDSARTPIKSARRSDDETPEAVQE